MFQHRRSSLSIEERTDLALAAMDAARNDSRAEVLEAALIYMSMMTDVELPIPLLEEGYSNEPTI